MAIGGRVVDLLRGVGLDLSARASLPDAPVMPNLGEAFPRPYQREDLIDSDPQYGSIVCFCERVTHGEIRDALRSSLPPSDLDGLRRRTRAAMGRCQGFYCGAEVDALLRGRGGA
jgi:glycerol-3-phosphate dehydrogenase